jgi:hypothetical protein
MNRAESQLVNLLVFGSQKPAGPNHLSQAEQSPVVPVTKDGLNALRE